MEIGRSEKGDEEGEKTRGRKSEQIKIMVRLHTTP